MDRVSHTERDYREEAAGVYLADLAGGERASMKHWRIEPVASLPVHRHSNEQIGYLVSGRLTAVLDDREVVLKPGDSYAFSSKELHGAENRGDKPAIGIGIMSPPRDTPDWGDRQSVPADLEQAEPAELDD